jgi:site-specific DNA-cytosine methylase
MKVLSLFDGMSCGQIALNQLGYQVDYYASEIKKHAIKCTLHNFPSTIEIGDIKLVSYKDGVLSTQNGSYNIDHIDLLIGGSPCQDLSGLMSDRKGLSGDKSSLFWEYVRILRETEPTYFMLENVGSMDIKDAQIITSTLGVNGFRINSALVSAQERDRIYWTNIPGDTIDLFGEKHINMPRDRHILLSDIIESGYTDRDKAFCLTARGGYRWGDLFINDKYLEPNLQKRLRKRYKKGFDTVIFEGDNVRLLTRREIERLQTVPEGYTDCLKYTDAFNVLGDGWTIEVIKHIFKNLPKNI